MCFKVEYKDQLAFEVKKSDGEPIEFQPVVQSSDHPDNRQVIYFNYDSIVDFSIGVKGNSKSPETTTTTSTTATIPITTTNATTSASTSDESESDARKPETLNAQIEVFVNGDYDFQIVKKDTQEPIDINVRPKMNNVYKIEFNPSPVTGYTLKANRRHSQQVDQVVDTTSNSKILAYRQFETRAGLKTNVSGICPSNLSINYSICSFF